MPKENSILPVGERPNLVASSMMDLWKQSIEGARRKGETVVSADESDKSKLDNQLDKERCRTCAERKYRDVSDDEGVSFQTPGHISPGSSASVVMSHEREHVVRNRAKAEREGGEVVHSSVTLQYAICPECGRSYVAGGTTHTTTETPKEQEKAANAKKQKPAGSAFALDALV